MANLTLVHLPVHASWLNQIEIYFSVVQRKVLTPNDFIDLAEVAHRLLGFQRRYEQTAVPFEDSADSIDQQSVDRSPAFEQPHGSLTSGFAGHWARFPDAGLVAQRSYSALLRVLMATRPG